MEKFIAQLEALLFIYGEPITFKKIAGVLKVEESKVEEAVEELARQLKADNRGLSLLINGNKVQLATKGEFKNIAEAIVKEELNEPLTSAALETLSIIVYAAPITRSELEYIRGVNSSYILRSLLIRGLIRREQKGHTFVYMPTMNLLRHLGINRREDLPEFQSFHQLMNKVRNLEKKEQQSNGEERNS